MKKTKTKMKTKTTAKRREPEAPSLYDLVDLTQDEILEKLRTNPGPPSGLGLNRFIELARARGVVVDAKTTKEMLDQYKERWPELKQYFQDVEKFRVNADTTVVENQTATCFCGRKGEYTGCSPAGSNTGPLRVAFKCDCGKVWGFLIPRADLEKYRS